MNRWIYCLFLWNLLGFSCFLEELFAVQLGVDTFFSEYADRCLARHQGKKMRVAIARNQTSMSSKGKKTLQLFLEDDRFQVKAIFTPEHGFFGKIKAAKKVGDSSFSSIPIYSLYGKTRRPTPFMLRDLDLIVYDIQSIGVRSYTYETTLFYIMEEAAKKRIPVVVLDRPNPMGGSLVDGLFLEKELRSFIGYLEIPYCHGMTIGGLARYFNGEYQVGCTLHIASMKGWKRSMDFASTRLFWIAPSPNIPRKDTPFYYSSTGILGELGAFSLGLCQNIPFQMIAAPWIDGRLLAEKCNAQNLPGIVFFPLSYKASKGAFKGQQVSGVFLRITNTKTYQPLKVHFLLLGLLKSLHPKEFLPILKKAKNTVFSKALGSKKAQRLLEKKAHPFWSIASLIEKDRRLFLQKRARYLLPEYGP